MKFNPADVDTHDLDMSQVAALTVDVQFEGIEGYLAPAGFAPDEDALAVGVGVGDVDQEVEA